MSLQEKSAQTISEEIENFKSIIYLNQSHLQVLDEIIAEKIKENERCRSAIQERRNQLELRAKAKR